MKKLFLKLAIFAVCLFSAQSAFAAPCSNTDISNGWTCVISVSAQSTDGTTAVTSSVNTSTANQLVVGVATYIAIGDATLTDSKGNTWTPRTRYVDIGSDNFAFRLYDCNQPCTVGSGHTFTATSTASYPGIAMVALKTAASSPFDVENGLGTSGAGNSTLQPNTGITPSENNEVVVIGVHLGTGTSVASIDSSFTIYEQLAQSSGAGEGIAIALKTQSTAAAVNPTWSFSPDNIGATAIASYKQGTGGGGGGVACFKSLLGVGGC